MRIQHNIAALNAHRQLGNNNSAVSKNLEKLSSGYRINRAGDDAAGLAISEKMRAQIKGLETASKNAQDGVSLIQTAEGALTEVHSMLNRMVELATQSANGTYGTEERTKINNEVNALKDEIDRISEGTNFNGINLLDGSIGGGTTGVEGTTVATGSVPAGTKVKVSGAEGITVKLATAVKATTGGATVKAAWVGKELTLTIEGDNGAKITQDDINAALKAASAPEIANGLKVEIDADITLGAATTAATGGLGAAGITTATAKYAEVAGSAGVKVTSNKAGNDTRKIEISTTGAQGVSIAANGDVTVGLSATGKYTAADINNMLQDAGADMTISYDGEKTAVGIGLTTAGGTALAGGAGLAGGGGLTLQVGDTNDSFQKVNVSVSSMSATSLGLNGVNTLTQDSAGDSIKVIKSAIEKVSTARGDLGALQNRLDHTINNLGVTTENMTAAESRIRDVDMAQEMMTYTKNNILTQASQAMLAQANQLPQGVLQLLQ